MLSEKKKIRWLMLIEKGSTLKPQILCFSTFMNYLTVCLCVCGLGCVLQHVLSI